MKPDDGAQLHRLATEYGADNPAVVFAKWACEIYPDPSIRNPEFWPRMEEVAKYCNEIVGPTEQTVVDIPSISRIPDPLEPT